MNVKLGENVSQPEGFEALVLNHFPSEQLFVIPNEILVKNAEAERLVGKLDGITEVLSDADFFIRMFLLKDATASAQIEGARATTIDALEADVDLQNGGTDVQDILDCVEAYKRGKARMASLPVSLLLIREVHQRLMSDPRYGSNIYPGEFRKLQVRVGNFYPPPAHSLSDALGDFDGFLQTGNNIAPLIHIGLAHAHFETIHPFVDGNGRTGRVLIALMLRQKRLLDNTVLPLSSLFMRYRQLYYQKLSDYHNGDVESWIHFFLDCVIEIALESIETLIKVKTLCETDQMKIQTLGKRESKSGMLVLRNLLAYPMVTSKTVMYWSGFTRAGAQGVIDRLVELDILKPYDESAKYDRSYVYHHYVRYFTN